MISLSSPLRGVLVVTPHGDFGVDRPERHGVHQGLDFAAEEGDLVQSASDGAVARIGYDKPVAEGGGGGGNYVIVRSVDGSGKAYEVGYMHLEHVLAVEGTAVHAGDVLGTAGATGTREGQGVHLHFQVKQLSPAMALNPTQYLPIARYAGKAAAKSGPGLGTVLMGAAGIWKLWRALA